MSEEIIKDGELRPFRALGNDLYADVGHCNCPHRIQSLSEMGFKNTIKLTGYYDDHFFDVVNKDFRVYECSKCGYTFLYKWIPEGVLIKERI